MRKVYIYSIGYNLLYNITRPVLAQRIRKIEKREILGRKALID